MKTIQFTNSIEVCKSAKGHLCIFMHYQHGKKQHRDKVEVVAAGPSLKRRQNEAVGRATDTLKTKRAEITLARLNGTVWTHPKDVARSVAEQETKQQASVQAERDALLYETVVADFLRDEAFDDANPKETASCLERRCARAFAGKSWADLTQQDRERYTLDRLKGRLKSGGWFTDCNPVGPRSPANELATLRRVGNYLMRCGKMQNNPFASSAPTALTVN